MNLKRELLSLLPYAAVLAADFWLLPLCIQDTGSAMILLLCIVPAVVFCCGLFRGLKGGSWLWLSCAAMLLFAPSVFGYYNATAWVYIPIYGAVAAAGCAAGRLIRKIRK